MGGAAEAQRVVLRGGTGSLRTDDPVQRAFSQMATMASLKPARMSRSASEST